MIRFNSQTQQVMGDNTDPRLLQIIKHHPKFPLAFWSFCDRHQGIDAFAVNNNLITETVGLHDVTLEDIEINEERSYLHVYDNAYVNSITMTAGELHIMHGGYVAKLMVSGPSVVHITGHVAALEIRAEAQVFLYDGAYVDNMSSLDEKSLVRIYKGAKVYFIRANKSARIMVEELTSINRTSNGVDNLIPFSQPPKDSTLVKVCIRFHSHEDLLDFCKAATDEYQYDARLSFGECWVAGLHHKMVYDSCYSDSTGIDTVEFCADMASDTANKLIPAIRKDLMQRYKNLAGNIHIWWRGQPELEAIKIPVEQPKVTARSIDEELREAMAKATSEQWARLIHDVFGDDTRAEGAPHRTHDE